MERKIARREFSKRRRIIFKPKLDGETGSRARLLIESSERTPVGSNPTLAGLFFGAEAKVEEALPCHGRVKRVQFSSVPPIYASIV